jgi:TatD DNase family protein
VVGSLHCYQGSVEMARQFIKLGFYIGVGGPVTNENNKKTRKVVNEIDVTHMLVETDSPYLPPQQKKGEINTPLNIGYVTGKIAEELDMNEYEVIEITSKNARTLFKI